MLRTTNRLVFASLASLMFVGCGGGGDEADLTGAGGAGQSDAASDTSTGGKAGSGGSAGSAGTAGAAGSAGTGGTAGMGGSAGTAGSAGADAGDDAAPVCTKGDFKCEGDVLQTCTEDGSQYLNVASCKAGLCDAAGKQCDNCVAKETKCLTDSRLQTCSDDGQMVSEADCPASAKFCAVSGGVASCIECTKTADCVVSTSECQMAACGTDGICGTVLVAKDTPCGAVGAGGKCDGAGACRYCSAGEVRCSSLTPETCDAEGQWIAGAACGGNEPLCLGGACVQCVSAGDCPASSNECVQPACDAVNACGYTPKATGTGCANGLGKCDGAGQCNVCTPGTAVCNGNVPLVCGANGQYAPQPACGGATPNCDAATGTCVQCTTATQCALGNECLTASCTANTCGYLPKPSGTACTGGTCSPLGTCQACTPGAVKCVGESVQTCNSSGQYDPVVACVAPKPYCDDATTSCVECETAGQCPAASNECLVATCTGSACGFAPKPADTNCAGGTGKCNGAGQCNVCTPGTRICNGNVPLLCESNGQYAPQAACSGATANCDPATGTCVQCTVASQCPASGNPCLDAVCNSNTCGFAPKQLGAACPGGTCSGSGVCWACTPSTEVCSGNGVLTCNVNGQYDPIANCVAPKPYCEPGSVECVECMTAGQCTTPVNPCLQATCAGNVCGIGNKADGTSCAVASDTGTCSAGNCRVCTTGAKRCKTGVTNVAQTCDANGQWQDSETCSGGTPVCSSGACSACSPGASVACPARDCQDVLANNATSPSGVYWVKPLSLAVPMQVQCEMSLDGGGWTLVYKRGRSSPTDPHACSSTEVNGVNVAGLSTLGVTTTDRVCGPQGLLANPATAMRCEWVQDAGTTKTTVIYDLAAQGVSPWGALTLASTSFTGPCTIVGVGTGALHPHSEALWTCNYQGVIAPSVWHTTGCCGGPWTFSEKWDYSDQYEYNGRCWMR